MPSSEPAISGELTSDEITNRLNCLDITQEDSTSVVEITDPPTEYKEQQCDNNAGTMSLTSDCCNGSDEQQCDSNAGTMSLTSDCCTGSDEQQCDSNAGTISLTSDCCNGSDEKQHDGNAGTMSLTSDCCNGSDEQQCDSNADTMSLTSDCCSVHNIDDVINELSRDDNNENDADEPSGPAASAVDDDIDSSSLVTDSMFYIFTFFLYSEPSQRWQYTCDRNFGKSRMISIIFTLL